MHGRIVESTRQLEEKDFKPGTKAGEIKKNTTSQLLLSTLSELNPYLAERAASTNAKQLLIKKLRGEPTHHLATP